jgi:hypothetical protein
MDALRWVDRIVYHICRATLRLAGATDDELEGESAMEAEEAIDRRRAIDAEHADDVDLPEIPELNEALPDSEPAA